MSTLFKPTLIAIALSCAGASWATTASTSTTDASVTADASASTTASATTSTDTGTTSSTGTSSTTGSTSNTGTTTGSTNTSSTTDTSSSSGTTSTTNTGSTSSTTATSTNTGTTSTTASTTASTAASTALAIDFTDHCGKGGTRSTKGSFDLASGALDITVTLAHCGGKKGVVVDGTDHISGSFLLVAGSESQWKVDMTDTIDQTDSGGAKNVAVLRKCTITKKGTFDEHKDAFDGEVLRTNCSVTGKFPEQMGIVEHLLQESTKLEEEVDADVDVDAGAKTEVHTDVDVGEKADVHAGVHGGVHVGVKED